MCYIILDSNFLLFILRILLFNTRCLVINHTNICLDLSYFRKSVLYVLVSQKKSTKFQPNFAKFGNFDGGLVFFAIPKLKTLAPIKKKD
jgi:hypothetical protein